MAPYRMRSLIGAAVLGVATAVLTGCECLPEIPKLCKDWKPGKLLKQTPIGKFAKKLKGLKEPEVPVMPEIVAPAPTPPPQSALNLAPGAPPPGPPTVWSKLGLSPEQREYRKRMLMETPTGKLLAAASKPISKLTLGLIGEIKPPPVPTLKELLDKGAIGAKAKVKLDKLNAKKRKEAVEELKDVDCHYWPEAEEALIAALRTDRNEAVRYTAAKTLAGGKCCTKKTIEALIVCSSGSDRDGAPCEVSATVRATAAKALEKCLSAQCLNRCGVKYVEVPCPEGGGMSEEKPREEEEPRAVVPASAKPPPPSERTAEESRHVQMVAYYERAKKKSIETIAATARELLARVSFPPDADAIPAGHPDYEAVDLYPDPPPAPTSPRPEGLFDRPAVTEPPAKPSSPPLPSKPRDPSRPVNILDLLTQGGRPPEAQPPAVTKPPPQPGPRIEELPRDAAPPVPLWPSGVRTEEPPRAPPGPIVPVSVVGERE